MEKTLSTSEDALIELIKLSYDSEHTHERQGMLLAVRHLFARLSDQGKKTVSRFFAVDFIERTSKANWVQKILLSPDADMFGLMMGSIKDRAVLDSLVKELARDGYRFVEGLMPILGRPLSEEEITLLCASRCKGGAYSSSDESEFYNLAIRNGHSRAFAKRISSKIAAHKKELESQLD